MIVTQKQKIKGITLIQNTLEHTALPIGKQKINIYNI